MQSQIAQELSEWDKVSQLQFCSELLVNNNHDIVNTLLLSDEAHFCMSSYVNKQNCHYWAPNNPRELNQRHLHSAEMTVFCAVLLMALLAAVGLRMRRNVQ
jgi:hypothetical protein